MKDDLKAGVKSTATLYGGKGIRPLLIIFGTTIMLCIFAAGLIESVGLLYHVISVGGGCILFARELWEVNLSEPASCLRTVCPTVQFDFFNTALIAREVQPQWFCYGYNDLAGHAGRLCRENHCCRCLSSFHHNQCSTYFNELCKTDFLLPAYKTRFEMRIES